MSDKFIFTTKFDAKDKCYEVKVKRAEIEDESSVKAKIDTGATMSVINDVILRQLLFPYGKYVDKIWDIPNILFNKPLFGINGVSGGIMVLLHDIDIEGVVFKDLFLCLTKDEPLKVPGRFTESKEDEVWPNRKLFVLGVDLLSSMSMIISQNVFGVYNIDNDVYINNCKNYINDNLLEIKIDSISFQIKYKGETKVYDIRRNKNKVLDAASKSDWRK